MRPMAQCDGLHFRRRSAFEIQRDGNAGDQRLDIGVTDVAAVFAQMGGDAVSTCHFRQKGGAQGVGPGRAACVAHGGDVVDVDAETEPSEGFHMRVFLLVKLDGD